MATMTPVEPQVRDVLAGRGVDMIIAVPCKYVARLLEEMNEDSRFEMVYPSREEEGLGIAAGAYLAGRKPVLVMQNSGLGTLANAYCSLNQYYGIPLCCLVTFRGDELERVPAQKPMGAITRPFLDLLEIPTLDLKQPKDVGELATGLDSYVRDGKSLAVLTRKTFWTMS